MTGPSGKKVKIVRLAHARGLALPSYQTAGAAGLDLVAAVAKSKPITLKPGRRALVPTGFVIELPSGMEAQVRPRSGLALKHGVTVLNAPGTIDADYRGEVMALLINHGAEDFVIVRGERIAQLVVQAVQTVRLVESEATTQTKRGAGGFGSTGQRSETRTLRRDPRKKNIGPKKPKRKKSPAAK